MEEVYQRPRLSASVFQAKTLDHLLSVVDETGAVIGEPAPEWKMEPIRSYKIASTLSRKTAVWRSTSAAVACGAISAMLWNGVIRMPRLSAARCM